jgi:ubiquinone/menaquinone biosynthesis C-methylase UbiE
MTTKELAATYDRIARDYAEDHKRDTWSLAMVERFVQLLSKRARVLDVGCGPGWEAQRFARAGFRVTGIDISPKLIALAKRRVLRGRFIVGDMRSLPFAAGTFHGICAKASLLHLQRREVPSVLASFRRVLKRGGLLLVAVKEGRESEVVREREYGYRFERPFTYFGYRELTRMLERAGFHIREELRYVKRKPGKRPWLQLIAQRR